MFYIFCAHTHARARARVSSCPNAYGDIYSNPEGRIHKARLNQNIWFKFDISQTETPK